MKLPIRALPQYTVHLPASDITVTYRPHTVKEEQILNMASMSDTDADKMAAVFQICENCVEYDITKLFPAEVEYLFMKIKACSDSPKVPVVYMIDPELDENGENIHKDCGESITSAFDINKDVEVVLNKDIEKYATRGKDGTWIVDLKDGLKMQVRVKALIEVDDDSIYELVESIIDEVEDTVMFKEVDFNKEEFIEWVGSLSSYAFEDFNNFMASTPSCVAHLNFKCKCGKKIKEDETGVIRFLV